MRALSVRDGPDLRHPEAAQTAKDLGGDDRSHDAPVVAF
jgi:hypothetical protein